MKLLERMKLGILRKPVKTLLLFLIMFVIVNVLSSSLILFNVTQSVKENIDKKITPVVFIKKLYSLMNLPSVSEFNYNNTDKEEAYFDMLKALNEINELEEVIYMDICASGITMYYDSIHYIHDLIENNRYNEEVVDAYTSLNGVTNSNPYLFKSGVFKIVEGRNFTDEEINTGKRVLVMPKNEAIIVKGRYKMPEVGDKISLSYVIVDGKYWEMLYGSSLLYENAEEFLSKIVAYQEYEFEIIGLYEKVQKLDTVRKNKIVPYKIFDEINNDYIHDLNELINNGTIINLDEYGREIYHTNKDRWYQYSCFEIDPDYDIKEFKDKVDLIMNKHGYDKYGFHYGNEEYLKIVGPLESLNTVSKTILIIGIAMSIVIIGLVSIMMVKDRRHEIGILLTLGESKAKIMIQLMLEMLCIGLLAVSLSLFTSKGLTRVIENNVLSNHDYYKGMDDYESTLILGVTKEDVLNQYNTELEANDMMTIALVSSCVLVITSGMSILFVFKMNPKEILM